MSRARKTEPRCRQLNLSLTDSEMENIRQRAEAVGLRPVHFGRAILLDEQRKIMPAATAGVATPHRLAYQQLARLGANLNQMMHFCHRTGFPPPADLEPLLRDIRQLLGRRFGDGA